MNAHTQYNTRAYTATRAIDIFADFFWFATDDAQAYCLDAPEVLPAGSTIPLRNNTVVCPTRVYRA